MTEEYHLHLPHFFPFNFENCNQSYLNAKAGPPRWVSPQWGPQGPISVPARGRRRKAEVEIRNSPRCTDEAFASCTGFLLLHLPPRRKSKCIRKRRPGARAVNRILGHKGRGRIFPGSSEVPSREQLR